MNQKLINKTLKPFWTQVGEDYIANLSTMKKAIVVAFYCPKFPTRELSYYSISPRSYFPFTDEQLGRKFDNYHDCCLYSEGIILNWISSLFTSLDDSESKPLLVIPKLDENINSRNSEYRIELQE